MSVVLQMQEVGSELVFGDLGQEVRPKCVRPLMRNPPSTNFTRSRLVQSDDAPATTLRMLEFPSVNRTEADQGKICSVHRSRPPWCTNSTSETEVDWFYAKLRSSRSRCFSGLSQPLQLRKYLPR